MDEYIKVKDLVDMLEQRLVFQETHGFYRDAGYTSRFIESITDIPHIDVAPKSEWISVEDRLPDRDGRYLVAMKNGNDYHISTRKFKRTSPPIWWKGHTYGYWARQTGGVRYWMPLPSPPIEKEN